MILEKETKEKYGLDLTKKFSKNILIMKCDICGDTFEKSSIKVFSCRKNEQTAEDVCENIECIKKKREKSIFKKYGVTNAGLSKELMDRAKMTCIKKYGKEYAMLNENIQQKSKDKCFEKYGVTNVFSSQWCVKEIKKTNLKKYGVEWSSQNKDIRKKIEDSFIEKYGVKYPTLNDDIKKKLSESWLNKIYKKIETESIRPLFEREDFQGFGKNVLYKFQCKKCDNIFENNYLGVACYKCNPIPKSKIENELEFFINEIYKGTIKRNCRKILDNKFELDFYFPDLNVAIELNGNYYHSEISGKKDKNYHLNKLEYCENKNIHLIQIFEDEWYNKKELIKSKLKHILKCNFDKSIYGRDCEVSKISYKDSMEFLNKNHIQGNTMSSIRIGLFYKNNLESVMTFSSLRKSMGNKSKVDNVYEIIRYSTSKKVVGGFSKLLSFFIKKYKPKKIISYADRRWTNSNENLYSKNGFRKVSDGNPNYWYVNKINYQRRIYRFNFRKDQLNKKLKLFNKNLTEWENMKTNGFDRIWDCGNLKYELDFNK